MPNAQFPNACYHLGAKYAVIGENVAYYGVLATPRPLRQMRCEESVLSSEPHHFPLYRRSMRQSILHLRFFCRQSIASIRTKGSPMEGSHRLNYYKQDSLLQARDNVLQDAACFLVCPKISDISPSTVYDEQDQDSQPHLQHRKSPNLQLYHLVEA